MRAKIFLIFLFATICHGEFISPIDDTDPNGLIEFHLHGSNIEGLDEALNNPDPRVCDKIYLDAVLLEDVQRIFEVYGKQARKLTLYGFNMRYNPQTLLNALNLLTNLEEMEISLGNEELDGEVFGTLNLKNFKKLIYGINFGRETTLDFVIKVFPENSIETLVTTTFDENFGEFLNKQRNIKDLELKLSDPSFTEAFSNLKLERIFFAPGDDETFTSQRKFVKDVIATQPELKILDFARFGNEKFIDDQLLEGISKLTKLEHFWLSLDGLTNLEGLENLKNLKELILQGEDENSLHLFNQFSNFKFESLEKLTLQFKGFDLSEETLEKISQNLPNLKSLEVPRNYDHSVNFYAQTFPQVEELTIEFGFWDKEFDMNAVIDGKLKVVHPKLKKVDLSFSRMYDIPGISVDDFVAILQIFPNLESLKIRSDFPFNADFFGKLSENLNNLKVVKLSPMKIQSEDLTTETFELVKTIASKLKHFEVRIYRDSPEAFNFQPLIDGIKDALKYKEDRYSLELFGGSE